MSTDSGNQENNYPTWRDRYLGIQGLVYLAQGIAMGVLLYSANYARSLGVDDFQSLLFQAVVSIPWAAKIIFGILSDNVKIANFGRRKPYVFLAGALSLLGWFSLPFYEEFSFLVVLSGLALSTGIAMADASVDALSVDITPPRRHGVMQGVSWGFRGLGFGIAAYIAGNYVDDGNWALLFMVPGSLMTLAAFLVLLIKEVPLPADFKPVPWAVYKEVFRYKAVQLTMLFAIVSGGTLAIVTLMQTYLEVDVGYTNTDVGFILMMFAFGMFAGAIGFGLLGDYINTKISLITTTILYIIVIASIALFDLSVHNTAATYFVLVGLINGGYEATQMKISMGYSPPILGGTMFNLFNSLSNLGQMVLGAIIIAVLADAFNYQIGWQFASVFLILALIPGLKVLNNYPREDTADIGKEVLAS